MTPGQAGYNAYREDAGGVSVHGEPLPVWADTDPAIRAHWEAAASGVADYLGAGDPPED